MAELRDAINARVAELMEQIATIQRRADAEIAAVQAQLTSLTAIQGALAKDPDLEAMYLTALRLKLNLKVE